MPARTDEPVRPAKPPTGEGDSDLQGAVANLDLAALNHRRRVAGKKMSFVVKAELEAGRPVGCAPGV